MHCQACGRELRSIRSRLAGYGPTCFRKHLETLTPEERELENMIGYNWCPAPDFLAPDWYLVITPEHVAYSCNPITGDCMCIDALSKREREMEYTCKHVRYIRRETNWSPPAPKTMSKEQAAIKAEIATDFA